MALTYLTNFDALVQEYIEPGLVDNYFKGTPVLDALRKTQRRAGGDVIQTLLEYAEGDAASVADKAALTPTETDVATRSTYNWRHYYADVQLSKWELALSQEPEGLADLMQVITANAMKAMKKVVSSKLFVTQATTNLDALIDAADDGTTTDPYGGIAVGDFSGWAANVMEDDAATSGAVAPSITNFKRMIRRIQMYSGEKPDMCVVHPDLYDIVEAQVDDNDFVSMIRLNSGIEVGYDAININGCNIVADLDMIGDTNTAANRSDGYEAMFLNWSYVWLAHFPATSWKFEGWQKPYNYRDIVNYLWLDGNVVCSQRRALGRIYNIDITLDPNVWVAGAFT